MNGRDEPGNGRAPQASIHHGFETNPGGKSQRCGGHPISDGYNLWVLELELRKVIATQRELTSQPMMVLVFGGTHPFVRSTDHSIVEAVRDNMALDLVGLPIAQEVAFCMNKVDSTEARHSFGLQQGEDSFWHRHRTKLGRNFTGWKQPTQGQKQDCTRVAACTEALLFFSRVRTPCGHGAQVIVEGREEQSDGGKKNKDPQTNPKPNTTSPQAESPPSCSLSSTLGETRETKTNDN